MAGNIRKATPDDYTDVMAISENGDLYGGYDYLPNEYHSLISSHGGYVLEINDKVVGFIGYEIVDQGTCFIEVGGRILPSMRNQGLFKHLKNVVTERIKEKFPSIKTSRQSTLEKSSFLERIMRFRRSECCVFFFYMPVHSNTDFASYGLQPRAVSGGVFKVLSSDELQKVCDCDAATERIVSTGYMIVDMRFYKFKEMEASQQWKTFRSFHYLASFQKGDEKEPEKASTITLAYIALLGGPDSTTFKRFLGLDINGHLTRDLLVEVLSFAFNFYLEKEIAFDGTRVTVPEMYEDMLKSIFPTTIANAWNGKILLIVEHFS